MAGSGTPSFTVTSCVSQFTAKSARRIDFEDVQVLVDRLRLHVRLGANLGRDLVPGRAGDDHAQRLLRRRT